MAARVVVQQHQGKEVILLVGSESESDGDVEVVEEENLEQEEVVVVVYGRVKGSDPPIWVKREPGQGFVDHADGVEGRGLGEPGAPSTKAPKIIDVNEWFPSTEEEEGGEDGDDDEEEEVEILEPPPAAAAAAAAAAVKAEVEVIEILDDGEEADDEREEGGSTGVASAAPPASPPRPALLPAAGAKVKGKGADKKGKGKAKSSVKREGDGDGEQQQKAAAAAAGAGRKRQRPQPRRPAAEEEEGEEGAAAVAPARSKPAKAAAGKGKKGSSKKCKSSSGRGMLLVTQPLALVRSDEEEGAGEADGEEPTALQLRFKGENLVKISPEYQLEWIRTVQELKQDHLLHLSKADAAVGYNNLAPEDWDALRREVLRIAARKPKADKQERLERVMGNKTRMFLYAACISQRCADHGLVTHGPWARYVEKALRIPKHSLKWSNCLGIYVLISHPGATPCGWHADFCPDAPARDAYLHKVVNVFVPLQDMTERMGFTVVLDREKGRCQIPARQQGQWYALDPGYPHAADGYAVAEGEKAEALPPRMLLNISYIRRDFSPALRKHVVSYEYFYRAHLPPEVWRDR